MDAWGDRGYQQRDKEKPQGGVCTGPLRQNGQEVILLVSMECRPANWGGNGLYKSMVSLLGVVLRCGVEEEEVEGVGLGERGVCDAWGQG